MFKLNLEKAEETEIKLKTFVGSSKRQESCRKTSISLFWLCQSLDCVDHNKLWKTLQEMGIPDHLICLLKNLYAGQEATIRTRHGTMQWFQIGKGVHQGCILSRCLFNLYAENIIWNARLDEAQAVIKIVGKNIDKFMMDREAWCAVVHGVTKSQVRPNDWTTNSIWELFHSKMTTLVPIPGKKLFFFISSAYVLIFHTFNSCLFEVFLPTVSISLLLSPP